MQSQGLKSNFVYQSLRVISTACIGLIMMPYVNRTLGVQYLGKVEYANTLISYFLMFSALGIPLYGIREVAKLKGDKAQRSKLTFELLIILFFTSVLSYTILWATLFYWEGLQDYKSLIILLSSSILLTNMGAEWYFQGMENQRFITIRFLIIRCITLVLLFLLVRSSADYYWYALLLVLNSCGANLVNFVYLYRSLDRSQLKTIGYRDLTKHWRPIFTIFVATISINIYLQLDILLLGTLVGDHYVGLYVAANRLLRFVITFITTIGVVLLPRLSSLYQNDKQNYEIYLKKGFDSILLLSVPSTIFIFIFAHEIIYYMAGADFQEAVITLKILSPLCIVVGMAYFFGYLFLYVQGKEKIYTHSVLVSAVVSIIANSFMIKNYYHNGAAIVAVMAEVLAVVQMLIAIKLQRNTRRLIDVNVYKLLMANAVIFIGGYFGIQHMPFYILLILMLLAYSLLLWILKENTTRWIVYTIKMKIK